MASLPRTVAFIISVVLRSPGSTPLPSAATAPTGFITEGAHRGILLPELMAFSGHKNVDVAYRCYQTGTALQNPTARLAG